MDFPIQTDFDKTDLKSLKCHLILVQRHSHCLGTGKMVRLITHNMLTCHASESLALSSFPQAHMCLAAPENCNKDNFPLVFSEVELVIREAPENLDFIVRFMPKLEWNALVDTARSVS